MRFFDRSPNANYGKFYFGSDVQVTDMSSVGGRVVCRPSSKLFTGAGTTGLTLTDALSVDLTLGKHSGGNAGFGVLGVYCGISPDLLATLS